MNEQTSVHRRHKAPIPRMHRPPLAPPPLSPFYPVPLRRSLFFGPEAEVESGDEEDPVECGARLRAGRVEGFGWAEVEGVRAPCTGAV